MSLEGATIQLSPAVIIGMAALWPILAASLGAWVAVRWTSSMAAHAAFRATEDLRESFEAERLATGQLRDEAGQLLERAQVARRAAAASESNAKRKGNQAPNRSSPAFLTPDQYAAHIEMGGEPDPAIEAAWFSESDADTQA